LNYEEKRIKMKLTQEQVAQKLGISLYGYQLIERGTTKNPRKETLKKMKELFGKDIKWRNQSSETL